jgi:signal transduction histidine kinase
MTRVIRSSALFLAFGYIALGIVALVLLFALPLWHAWRVTINDGRTELLQEDARRLSAVAEQDGIQALAAFIGTRLEMRIAGERILLLADPAQRPIAGNVQRWPDEMPDHDGTYTIAMSLGGRSTHAVVLRRTLPEGYILLVGRDLARLLPLEQRFWYSLAGSVAILLVVGVMGGLLIRRRLTSRIHDVGHTLAEIMQGNLARRLTVGGRGDELDALLTLINRMLDQIEQLVSGIRNVSNTIAHDLRTPLAELRSRLETLVSAPPSPEETHAEIEASLAHVDRVIRIFDGLLRLAEIDAGSRRSGFVRLDAAAIVRDAVEYYLPAAELKGVTLSLRTPDAPVTVSGDPALLTQATSNLIDNALKYAQEGGYIEVELSRGQEGGAQISVSDAGPGIADGEKSKVAERFYRGTASGGTAGLGLGLTLVEAVARLHRGRLALFDNNPGLRAQFFVG